MPASLFDRLGGKAAITSVVADFRKRVAEDARINAKFARSDMPRLEAMLVDQVCEATGGPCRYTGRGMRDAHQGMRVTTGEFNALVDDLVATLNGFKVPQQVGCERCLRLLLRTLGRRFPPPCREAPVSCCPTRARAHRGCSE